MTRTWRGIWPGNTQKSFKERIGTYVDVALVTALLLFHLIYLIKSGPKGYIMMLLEAFAALVPG